MNFKWIPIAIYLSVLGGLVFLGYRQQKNELHAVRIAAEAGNATAQKALGEMYENGSRVEQNATEAVKWYRKSADQGHADAQLSLSRMYEKGEGVKKDEQEAEMWRSKWVRTLREDLDVTLKSVDPTYDPDAAKAARRHQDAADQIESMLSSYKLASVYESNDKNYQEAIRWYRRSAELGYSKAQFRLGMMLEEGNGAAKDTAEAAKWYRRASAQGESLSQEHLGMLYFNGEAVPHDDVEAFVWLTISNSRNPVVQAAKEQISRRMSPADLEVAQSRVAGFLPKSEN